jgi:hypothetical protein
MAKQDRTILKTYFNTGDRPSEGEFADLIDSSLNAIDDKATQADIDAGTNDERYITPLGASRSISTFVKDATTTTKGIAEIATLDEVATGTDSVRFVTPEGAKRAVETHALIKKVNNTLPDDSGNIQIDAVTGNAATATKLAASKNINGVPFDGSADISLPEITTITGNAGTATRLATSRNINGVAFNGTANIVIPAATVQSAFLTAAQTNNLATPAFALLTGHTFTIPAGKSAVITGNLIFTAAAITTGAGYGVKVAQATGANGNAIGSWSIEIGVTSAAAATGIRDGDVFNVAANTNASANVSSNASVAGNNWATLNVIIKNNATNVATTVTIEFQSKVASSAVIAQIGTGAVAVIS